MQQNTRDPGKPKDRTYKHNNDMGQIIEGPSADQGLFYDRVLTVFKKKIQLNWQRL